MAQLLSFDHLVDKMSLSEARIVGSKGMKVYSPTEGFGGNFTLCRGPVCEAQVAFPPSAFGNNPQAAEKLNVCLIVSDEILGMVEELESKCKQLLGFKQAWHSAIKIPSKDGQRPLLKVKMRPNSLRCFRTNGETAPMPREWARLPCNAHIAFRGVYDTGSVQGLQLEMTHLLWDREGSPPNPFIIG